MHGLSIVGADVNENAGAAQAPETWLVVVRHGETQWNRERRIQGYHADSALTATGEAQAAALAGRLAREGIDALFASDLGRTRSTAHPIGLATGIAPVHDAGLRERSYGIFEGRTFAEIEKHYPAEYARIMARDPHYAAPGGESALQFRDRVLGTLERIAVHCSGKRAAVVTHQGVLGMLYRHALELPLDSPKRPPMQNASCNHFRYCSGRWILESWCDVAHLDEGAGIK